MVADTQYTVGVIAVNSSGDGTRGQVTVKTAVAPPPSATGLPNPVRGIYDGNNTMFTYTNAALDKFNYILHAFLKGNGTLELHDYTGGASQLTADIATLDAAGRKVVASVGGAGDHTPCYFGDGTSDALYAKIVTCVDTYGFKGIDFDLEADWSTGSPVFNFDTNGICNVAAKLKAHYGANFIITCAPGPGASPYRGFATQTAWVNPTTGLVPYAGTLCDAIMPQFYDWRATDTARKQSMYDEVNALIALGVPASRIVIGGALPWGSALYHESGFNDGGNAAVVFTDAYTALKTAGKQVRGMFMWDAHWDANAANRSTTTTPSNVGASGNWKFRDGIYATLTATS
jgi:chitinase